MIENSKTVLKCINCDPTYELVKINPRSITVGKLAEYCNGFVGVQIYSNAPTDYNEKLDKLICPFCNNKLIDTGLPVGDFHLIGKATDWNQKLQQEQSDAIREQKRESNRPHCPFCNSTDVRKISGGERAVSILGLGLLSKKINKSFKCNKCGGTF